jgi:hypothetical protein
MMSSYPTTSSKVRGRIRAASGASFFFCFSAAYSNKSIFLAAFHNDKNFICPDPHRPDFTVLLYRKIFGFLSLFAKPPNMNFISEILIALRITYSKKQPGLRSKDIDKS